MRRRHPIAVSAALAALCVSAVSAVDLDEATPVSAATPARYLRSASDARARASAWWDRSRGWYRERLGSPRPVPLWDVVHLFGATNALAIARPTPARKAAVRSFARGAERYWNAQLRPVPGYGPDPDSPGRGRRAWFDDNGWWGIAFYDAYRATGDRRYLRSATRALRFVDGSGWDRRHGGIWWDTAHSFHAGESLATGTLLAAILYGETRQPRYLAIARRNVRWADATVLGDDGLYDRHERDATPMPYVQGPMAEAFVRLCRATGDRAWCDKGEALADRAARRFPRLTMGPQYDSMYIRSLLELYRLDHDGRWYAIAERETDRAMRNARTRGGLYLRAWDGRSMRTVGTPTGKLQTHAATTSAIAWMAAARPPGG